MGKDSKNVETNQLITHLTISLAIRTYYVVFILTLFVHCYSPNLGGHVSQNLYSLYGGEGAREFHWGSTYLHVVL